MDLFPLSYLLSIIKTSFMYLHMDKAMENMIKKNEERFKHTRFIPPHYYVPSLHSELVNTECGITCLRQMENRGL